MLTDVVAVGFGASSRGTKRHLLVNSRHTKTHLLVGIDLVDHAFEVLDLPARPLLPSWSNIGVGFGLSDFEAGGGEDLDLLA